MDLKIKRRSGLNEIGHCHFDKRKIVLSIPKKKKKLF
jgi:hypothetical protein